MAADATPGKDGVRLSSSPLPRALAVVPPPQW